EAEFALMKDNVLKDRPIGWVEYLTWAIGTGPGRISRDDIIVMGIYFVSPGTAMTILRVKNTFAFYNANNLEHCMRASEAYIDAEQKLNEVRKAVMNDFKKDTKIKNNASNGRTAFSPSIIYPNPPTYYPFSPQPLQGI
ncbi:hypothetical protein K488DRAFT_74919, partial [Vararia minispora EC-137]